MNVIQTILTKYC